ncbi:type II toxin-antitoxin system TacA family antitoxin [Luteimonas sp. RIT-PG2_3]
MSIAATKTINFRAPAAKQALIDRAAALSGKSHTEFILGASCESAREVLADQTHFVVSRDVMRRFNALIEAPLAKPETLRRLLSTPAPWER